MGETSLPEFDPTVPAVARVYDCLIGGKDHFAVDRKIAAALIPEMGKASRWRSPAVENRRFMERAVRHLLDAGIRQFIDIGCGMPTEKDNVHQIVHEVDPEARVVYVDYDPIVFTHYRALLHGISTAGVIRADARRPKEIVTHPGVTSLIDFSRPVGVLLVAILQLITDQEDPEGIVTCFRDAVPSGSRLVISHMTFEGPPRDAVDRFVKAFEPMREPMVMRSRDRIRALFAGMDLIEPGLVDAGDWHPDQDETPASEWLVAGVARTP